MLSCFKKKVKPNVDDKIQIWENKKIISTVIVGKPTQTVKPLK